MPTHAENQRKYYLLHYDRILETKRRWREKHRETLRETVRAWKAKNKVRVKEQKAEWNRNHKQICRAEQAAWRHIHLKEKCELCGSPATERHHKDHSKRLEVMHLCEMCHGKVHSKYWREA